MCYVPGEESGEAAPVPGVPVEGGGGQVRNLKD